MKRLRPLPQTTQTPNIAVGETVGENILSGKVLLKYFRVGENMNTHWSVNVNPVFRLIHWQEEWMGQTHENLFCWKEKIIRLVTLVARFWILGAAGWDVWKLLVEDRGFLFFVLTLLRIISTYPMPHCAYKPFPVIYLIKLWQQYFEAKMITWMF